MSTQPKDGGLVYPPALVIAGGSHNTINAPTDQGLTVRDYFAGLAMQSLIVSNPDGSLASDVKVAWNYADAMLRARGTTP